MSKQNSVDVLMPVRIKRSNDLKVSLSGRSFTEQFTGSHIYHPLSSTRAYEIIGPPEIQLYRVSIRDSYFECRSPRSVLSSKHTSSTTVTGTSASRDTSTHYVGKVGESTIKNNNSNITSNRVIGFDTHEVKRHNTPVSNLSKNCITHHDIVIKTSHSELSQRLKSYVERESLN